MHTPGPWIYEESTKTIRSKPANYWLASMDSWDGAIDNSENARLIAAAPDLLAALEALYQDWLQKPLAAGTGEEAGVRLQFKIDAAIAKAKP